MIPSFKNSGSCIFFSSSICGAPWMDGALSICLYCLCHGPALIRFVTVQLEIVSLHPFFNFSEIVADFGVGGVGDGFGGDV